MPNPSMNADDLQVRRHYDGQGPLQKNLVPSKAQEDIFPNRALPAGRCFSRNQAGEAELGVTGSKVPYWLFRRTDKPSGGWSGEPVMSSNDLTWADGSKHQFLFFVGIEGLEIATTEFIETDTFARDTFVSARPANNANLDTNQKIIDQAGMIFNSGVQYGGHPVVGVVSEPKGDYRRFNQDYVSLYTLYRPPIEAVRSAGDGGSAAATSDFLDL